MAYLDRGTEHQFHHLCVIMSNFGTCLKRQVYNEKCTSSNGIRCGNMNSEEPGKEEGSSRTRKGGKKCILPSHIGNSSYTRRTSPLHSATFGKLTADTFQPGPMACPKNRNGPRTTAKLSQPFRNYNTPLCANIVVVWKNKGSLREAI